jgi:hypothetical protein
MSIWFTISFWYVIYKYFKIEKIDKWRIEHNVSSTDLRPLMIVITEAEAVPSPALEIHTESMANRKAYALRNSTGFESQVAK